MKLPLPPSYPPTVSQELALNHNMVLHQEKPPVDCVLESFSELAITKAEVIDTHLWLRCPPQPLRKVVVTGIAQLVVKYVSALSTQEVHAALFSLPFETLIKWPEGPCAGKPACVLPVVEYFLVEKMSEHCLFAVLIIRLDVYNG